MPGLRMSTMKALIPACLAAPGSVLASRNPRSAMCAWVVHTFWPLTTHASPSRCALVRSDARSLPASGSLNS